MKPARKNDILCLTGFFAVTVTIALTAKSIASSAVNGLVAGLTVFFVGSVWYLAVLLRRSVRETLYSYRNVALCGGILFDALFAVMLTAAMITYGVQGQMLAPSAVYEMVISFPRQFALVALPPLGALCLLLGVSNIALVRHEGFCVQNLLSLVLAGFFLGGTAGLLALSEVVYRWILIPTGGVSHPSAVAAYTVCSAFLLTLLCYFETVFAGTVIFGWLAVRKQPDFDRDCIIILGCSIDPRGGLRPLLKNRTNSAYRFGWAQEIATGKRVKYIPSGGQGPNEIISEGSAMELYLLSHGAESYEVFPEKKSANTRENMEFSRAVIEGLQPDAKVAFATTNYHVFRSGILARQAGMDAQGIAGKTKWYFWPNGFIREYFALLAMYRGTHLRAAICMAVIWALLGTGGYLWGLI